MIAEAPLPASADVVVIGGGTAGATAARLLASWGHRVLMVEREVSRPPLAESLPPSCVPLLERIGVRAEIDAAGFVRGRGNTVWWGNDPMRVEPFPSGGLGYQVARSHLEQVLTTSAQAAGATRVHPATVVRVERRDDTRQVTIALPHRVQSVGATWVLDCSGRAGLLARAYRVAPPPDVRTIALVALWERDTPWALPDDTHTLVESSAWGWGWSVPLTDRTRCFTAMVDPHATPLVGESGLVSRYDALFEALPALGPILRGARRVSAPWACEATPYHSAEVAMPGTLFVGDAASMIDPLSSFGVKKALASAWLAAVVVHTALTTPQHAESALTLYREREAAYVRSATKGLSGLSRTASPDQEAPFWLARAEHGTTDSADESGSVAAWRHDPTVLEAFARLRAREAVKLLPNPSLQRFSRPVIRGNVIRPEDHLLLRGQAEAIRYLRSVDLLTVLEVASMDEDVGAMYERYARRAGPAPLPDFLGALSVLLATDALLMA